MYLILTFYFLLYLRSVRDKLYLQLVFMAECSQS